MDESNEENKHLITPTLPRWWRVLPSLVFIMMIIAIDSLILNDFIEYRYKTYYQVNSSSTDGSNNSCLDSSRIPQNSSSLTSTTTSIYSSTTTTTVSPNDLVQTATARLNVYISLAATIPSILTSILFGANCDVIGRKPLIVIPFVGKIIRYIILTAVAYYDLSDLWIILAILFDGIFGTGALSILSAFPYISDCTDEKSRTKATVITEVTLPCSKFIPLLTMGIYLEHPKFIQCTVFTLLLSVVGLVYSIVLQPESNLELQHLNIFQQLGKIRLRPITKILQVFFAKREGHKQRSLIILVCTHLCMIVMTSSFMAINYIYLYGTPFCMNSFGVSLTTTAQAVTMILLTIPYSITLAERTDHLALPMLGCLSFMIQLVLFGIANTIWMIYLAVCIGGAYNVLIAVTRSRITKLVEPNEYACVFIFASVFESGGSFAMSAMVNEIYEVSLTFDSGLVFFVIALFGGMAIILLMILHVLENRSSPIKNVLPLNE